MNTTTYGRTLVRSGQSWLLAALILSFSAFGSLSNAATLEILFEDIDISYDDSLGTIVDQNDPDPLTNVDFVVDGGVVGGIPAGATLDFEIPGVPAIADVSGTIVTSDPGGNFNFDFGGGNFLDLDLDEVTVTYISILSVKFAFGGSVAGIGGQDLPFGLTLGDPVSVSFSTTIDDITVDSGIVKSFLGSGTGEVEGAAVPEPTSLGIAALGGLLATMFASRYRLG